jgi:benzoylformate decarboxylase
VYASALASRCGFPENDGRFRGALPRVRSGVAEALRDHDVVLVLGAPAFNYHIHRDGPFVGERTRVVQITDDPRLAAAAVTGTSIVAALGPTLRAALPRITIRSTASSLRTCAVAGGDGRITIESMLATLSGETPRDAIVVEEAPSTHTMLHDLFPQRPGAFFTAASGSLGFGLPAAVGAALAAPGRRVLALIGDGSSHYGTAGLWTAARHALPITFVIVNNAGYGAMKSFVELLGSQRSPDFTIPGIDFVALAKGYGIPAARVVRRDELAAALRSGFLKDDGPSLIDVAVDAEARKLF